MGMKGGGKKLHAAEALASYEDPKNLQKGSEKAPLFRKTTRKTLAGRQTINAKLGLSVSGAKGRLLVPP